MNDIFFENKLIEGNWYNFKIVKSIDIADEEYFVLETPLKTRILLPQEPYHLYHFSINQSILCKVDKISCSGKIYLEPKHPYYQINNTYLFNFVEIINVHNLYFQPFKFVVLKDKLNQLVYLPLWTENVQFPKLIELRVVRIRKSKVIALPNFEPFDYTPIDGEWKQLTLINAFDMPDEGAFYLFEDELKKWHLAPKKYFGKELLPIGYNVRAITSKNRTNNYYHFEFEHPRYSFGSEVDFDIVSNNKIDFEKDNSVWQVSLNINGESQLVTLPLSCKTNEKMIKLKVGLIRKGKLTLEPIP
jgi:hypothetical protein